MSKKMIVRTVVSLLAMGLVVMATGCQQGKGQNLEHFSDLRGIVLERQKIDLETSDLREKYDVLLTATFDTQTKWPSHEMLPEQFDPEEIMEIGKDPGLGIRELHSTGITGKGVKVATIDQPLLLEHEEYVGKVAKYTTIECSDARPQMHGAAVAGLLVGKTCGVAPEAILYYWAQPSWERNYKQRTSALEEILAYNEGKSFEDKIKVVSVSIGYNSSFANLDEWKATLERAKDSGLIVVHCGEDIFGIGSKLYDDVNDPRNYDLCYFARPNRERITQGYIFVPVDNRTSASFLGEQEYTFYGQGGLSWGAPYLAGVIALGYQVDPNLSPDLVLSYIRGSGTPFLNGIIVNPAEFVRLVDAMK